MRLFIMRLKKSQKLVATESRRAGVYNCADERSGIFVKKEEQGGVWMTFLIKKSERSDLCSDVVVLSGEF